MHRAKEIKLTAEQLRWCDQIAAQRNGNKAVSDLTFNEKRYATIVMHIMGVRGELAAALATGGRMNDEVYGSKGDGGRPDIVLPCGCGASVKTRGAPRWDFLLNTKTEEIKTPFIILCWLCGRPNSIYVAGWQYTDEFLKSAIPMNHGHGAKPGLPFRSFLPIEWLEGECPVCYTERVSRECGVQGALV